jgi:creatinine amidohydrolase
VTVRPPAAPEARFASALPWTEVRRLAQADAIALLPVGSTEAHGPHLPLAVDVVIAEEVCRRVGRRLSRRGEAALIFPAVPYALTEFAAEFAGTISLPAEVARAFLTEVIAGLGSHGFQRIAVINHHLEPAHFRLVHEAAREAARRSGALIAVPDHRRGPTAAKLGDEFTHGGSHAGAYETSLMLAAAPHLVDEEARRLLPALGVDLPAAIKAGARTFRECGGAQAYFGSPSAATAAEGERLLEILAESAEEAIADLRPAG